MLFLKKNLIIEFIHKVLIKKMVYPINILLLYLKINDNNIPAK